MAKKKSALTTDHARLHHETGAGVRTYSDPNGPSLTVTSTLLSDPTIVPRRYRVELRRQPDATSSQHYSLFSLGIQGRRWSVEIIEATGLEVKLTKWNSPSTVIGSGIDLTVNQVLESAVPKGQTKVVEGRLWFLNFTGESCELKVTSNRPQPLEVKSEHDVAPPPIEGGGEDGDEE